MNFRMTFGGGNGSEYICFSFFLSSFSIDKVFEREFKFSVMADDNTKAEKKKKGFIWILPMHKSREYIDGHME